MAIDFARAADAGFRAFGKPARYCPADDLPRDCTVIVETPETGAPMMSTGFQLSAKAQEVALTADVRRSEVPCPKKGARLEVPGFGIYEIVREPILDEEKLVWTLPLTELRE
jgi:hypothetical protein